MLSSPGFASAGRLLVGISKVRRSKAQRKMLDGDPPFCAIAAVEKLSSPFLTLHLLGYHVHYNTLSHVCLR